MVKGQQIFLDRSLDILQSDLTDFANDCDGKKLNVQGMP